MVRISFLRNFQFVSALWSIGKTLKRELSSVVVTYIEAVIGFGPRSNSVIFDVPNTLWNLPATSTSTTTTIASPATAAVNTQSGASPTTTSPPQETKNLIGAIVGGIIGGMAVLGLIVGAIYFIFIRRRNQGQQQSGPFLQPQTGQVPKAIHDMENHDGMVQSAPAPTPADLRATEPGNPILGGRLRYPDTDAVGAPRTTQNVGDIPSGRLQDRNVE